MQVLLQLRPLPAEWSGACVPEVFSLATTYWFNLALTVFLHDGFADWLHHLEPLKIGCVPQLPGQCVCCSPFCAPYRTISQASGWLWCGKMCHTLPSCMQLGVGLLKESAEFWFFMIAAWPGSCWPSRPSRFSSKRLQRPAQSGQGGAGFESCFGLLLLAAKPKLYGPCLLPCNKQGFVSTSLQSDSDHCPSCHLVHRLLLKHFNSNRSEAARFCHVPNGCSKWPWKVHSDLGSCLRIQGAHGIPRFWEDLTGVGRWTFDSVRHGCGSCICHGSSAGKWAGAHGNHVTRLSY